MTLVYMYSTCISSKMCISCFKVLHIFILSGTPKKYNYVQPTTVNMAPCLRQTLSVVTTVAISTENE